MGCCCSKTHLFKKTEEDLYNPIPDYDSDIDIIDNYPILYPYKSLYGKI